MSRHHGPSLDPPDDPQAIMWDTIEAYMQRYIKEHYLAWGGVTEDAAHEVLDSLVEGDGPTGLVLEGIIAWAMGAGADGVIMAEDEATYLRT